MKIGYFFLFAFAISCGIVLFGEAGLLTAYKASQENARLEARINSLMKDNNTMLAAVEALEKSPRKLEHEVRTSLSLVAPDELLYEFQ